MSNTKQVAEYIYRGLGYPIKLKDVRFYLYDGEWCPILNIEMIALAEYTRLTQTEPEKIKEEHRYLIRQFEER